MNDRNKITGEALWNTQAKMNLLNFTLFVTPLK